MRWSARIGVLILGIGAVLALSPAGASAHPLGNFTINLHGGIRLEPGRLVVEYVVDMAEIPTFQAMAAIDADGDGRASRLERGPWAAATADELSSGLAVTVDDRPIDLRVVRSVVSFRAGQGALRTLRLEATLVGSLPRSGVVMYVDSNYRDRVGWHEITAVGEDGVVLLDPSVPARSVSSALRSYPQDPLVSPLDVRQATFRFRAGETTVTPRAGVPAISEQNQGAGGAFAGLVARPRLTVNVVLLSLFAAFGLGAIHVLGPGHGKAMMAAYLVGAGARVRHAVAGGAAISLMHTASVLGLGALILTAERSFAPEAIYPWIGLLSGLAALVLGAGLLVTRVRRRSWRSGHVDRVGSHEHPVGSPRHPVRAHGHSRPAAHPLSRKGLAALAVSGGVLPSPTALVVFLGSVALHREAFGLALIAAFSLGLAATLVLLGTLAITARDRLLGVLGNRWARVLPLAGAGCVVLIGIALVARSALQL